MRHVIARGAKYSQLKRAVPAHAAWPGVVRIQSGGIRLMRPERHAETMFVDGCAMERIHV
jgi:hypothetical protein